mgnify:CR=1 FL=1
MVLVRVRIDSRNHAASATRHPSSPRPFGSGRRPGTGEHNSDEALAANRFLSSHDRPDRPPTTAGNGRPSEPTRPFNDTTRSVRKQVRSRRSPVRRSSLFANSRATLRWLGCAILAVCRGRDVCSGHSCMYSRGICLRWCGCWRGRAGRKSWRSCFCVTSWRSYAGTLAGRR